MPAQGLKEPAYAHLKGPNVDFLMREDHVNLGRRTDPPDPEILAVGEPPLLYPVTALLVLICT